MRSADTTRREPQPAPTSTAPRPENEVPSPLTEDQVIGRSADFYGPGAANTYLYQAVLRRMLVG